MKRVLCLLVLVNCLLVLCSCAKKDPEPVLRERAQAFTQLLVDEKFDDAIAFCDPDFLASQGRSAVTGGFKLAIGIGKGLSQLGGRKSAGFELRKIDFDGEKTHASIQVVYFTTDANGGDRKEFPTDQKWVLKNKIWYTTK
jgi:hypothetical protein